MSRGKTSACIVACLALSAALCRAADPPMGTPGVYASPDHPFGWRGDGTGNFPGATPPLQWNEKENIKWTVTIGKSFSSPVLTEKCVLITAEPDLLLCIDRATGKVKWQARPGELTGAHDRDAAAAYRAPKDGAGLAAATAVTDGTTVYALYANGVVHAVDLDGKTKWTAFIPSEQNTGYGRSASPILCAGKLIIHMTDLYALDPATGKQLWVNKDTNSNYATPAPIKAPGNIDLIVTPAGDLVRAATGKALRGSVGTSVYTSPVVQNGVIYFGDDNVSATRLNAALKPEEIWTASIKGDIISSPICHDGLLFAVTCKGELYAFNLDGKGEQTPIIDKRPLLEGESATPRVFASLALAGNHLFLATTAEMLILDATADAKLLRRIPIPGGATSAPIFSGKQMFLRAGDQLLCISEEK